MAEATEELVKVFLEENGYLVTTSKRVDAKTSHYSPRAELDIIAIKTRGERVHNLPLRIAGEVKSFGVDPRSFEELDTQLRQKYEYTSRSEYGKYMLPFVGHTRYNIWNLVFAQSIKILTFGKVWIGPRRDNKKKFICAHWCAHVYNNFTHLFPSPQKYAPINLYECSLFKHYIVNKEECIENKC